MWLPRNGTNRILIVQGTLGLPSGVYQGVPKEAEQRTYAHHTCEVHLPGCG